MRIEVNDGWGLFKYKWEIYKNEVKQIPACHPALIIYLSAHLF